jgi:hypothetical protein
MSVANPLWGAPRIHGELLKLGIDIGQTTVAKYMSKRRSPPSQSLEDLSSQSYRRHRIDPLIRGSDDLVSPVVRRPDPAAFPPGAFVVSCDRTSDRRMDRPATDKGMRVATGAAIYRPRPGSRLWRCLYPPASSYGLTRSADRTMVTMAERVCGEADRIDPAGLS